MTYHTGFCRKSGSHDPQKLMGTLLGGKEDPAKFKPVKKNMRGVPTLNIFVAIHIVLAPPPGAQISGKRLLFCSHDGKRRVRQIDDRNC